MTAKTPVADAASVGCGRLAILDAASVENRKETHQPGEKDDDDKPGEPEHSEFHATWTITCEAPESVTGIETVYFANPRTASGGVLERDARCAGREPGEQAERARWTNPPPGRYRVGVDFLETCGGASEEVPYTLLVEVDGVRQELAGRARRAERQPLVLEFRVAAPAAREVR